MPSVYMVSSGVVVHGLELQPCGFVARLPNGSRATNPHGCSSSPCTTTPEETMYTLGIDLHKDESHVVVLDDNDEIADEVRVQNANLEEIARQYAG